MPDTEFWFGTFDACPLTRDRTSLSGSGVLAVEFARFLEFAKASLLETHNHLGDGYDLGYIPESACKEMRRLADREAGATTNLMKYLRRCAPRSRRR